ncbi:hypothetical protein [uncultured Methanobrevibacter sp.]|uniref:hypothetical protein n=1 Tax=uncultured Methanobrevibacter sp. TaxID=253161 RepID=UPI0026003ACA|nr:hypothetical protein [uncultured Methanobrevibacter sp.]
MTAPVTPSGPTVTITVAFSTVVIALVPLISIVEAALPALNSLVADPLLYLSSPK